MSQQNNDAGLETLCEGVSGTHITPVGEPETRFLAFGELVHDEWSQTEEELTDLWWENFPIASHEHRGHMLNCSWHNPNATCGPDTCHCNFGMHQHIRQIGAIQRNKFSRGVNVMERQYARRAKTFHRYSMQITSYCRQSTNDQWAEMTVERVWDLIRGNAYTCPRKHNDSVHACVFGYNQGAALNCGVCPASKMDRLRMCQKARFIRSYLNWLDLDTLVEETMDVEDKKSRGRKKFDKNKEFSYFYRKDRKQNHAPYWDVQKHLKSAKEWSTTTRAEKAMNKACHARELRSTKPDVLELGEAMQLMFTVQPEVRTAGLFNEKETQKHRVRVFDKIVKATNYALLKDKEAYQWRLPSSPIQHRAGQDWQVTFGYLVRRLAKKIVCYREPLKAFEETMTHMFTLDRGLCVPKREYEWLHPWGVVAFLSVVKMRGISDQLTKECHERFHLAREARSNITYETKMHFQDGTWPLIDKTYDFMRAGADSLDDQINMVRGVLERYRMPGKLDYHLFDPRNAAPWMYNKYFRFTRRLQSGTSQINLVEETMFSSTVAQAGQQMLADEKTRGGITAALADAIDPHFTKLLNLVEKSVQIGAETTAEARETMDKTNRFMEKMDTLIDQVQPGLVKTVNATSGVSARLDRMSAWIEGVINQLGGLLPEASQFAGLPDQWWKSININEVLTILDAYISWIHVKSTTVRVYILLRTLYKLNLCDKIASAAMWCWEQIQKHFVEETADDNTSFTNPTSWYEMLVHCFDELDVKKASWLAGVFTILLCGTKLPFSTMKDLGKRIMSMLTNMHFVGLGLLGGKRIFEYLHGTLTVVIDWIRANVFKLPAKANPDVVAVGQWAARVKFFVTEAGIRTIKVSAKAMEEAETLYAKGIEYYLRSQKDSSWLGIDMTRMVAIMLKDAVTIENVIYRIKTYANFRPTMFHIQLTGPPGIGKSTMTSAIVARLKEQLFPNMPEQNLVYALSDCEYYDGYNGQPFIVGDDLWKYNDAKHGTAIVSLITNVPVQLPQSHLEDKGQYLDSEIMISSVNDPYFEFKDVIDQTAIYRRRHALVQVKSDPNVMDEATHKFDMKLFKKHYPDQDVKNFPHLKFNFLKPVPDRMDPHEYTFRDGTINLDAKCDLGAYQQDDPLPSGMKHPLTNLSFEEMMSLCEQRYRAMRLEEKNILPYQKKERMQQCWDEIDDAVDAAYGGNPPSRFLQGLFMPPEIPLEVAQQEEPAVNNIVEQLMDQAYEDQVATNIDEAVDSSLGVERVEETMESEYQTANSNLDTEAEQRRANRILRQRGRRHPGTQNIQGNERTVDMNTGLTYVEGRWYLRMSSNYQPMENMYNRPVTEAFLQQCRERGREGIQDLIHFKRVQNGNRRFYINLGDDLVDPLDNSKNLRLRPSAEISAAFAERARKLKWDFVRRCRKMNGDWFFSLDYLERAIVKSQMTLQSMPSDIREILQQILELEGIPMEQAIVFRDGAAWDLITLPELALSNSVVYDQMCYFMDEFADYQRESLVESVQTVIQRYGTKFWSAVTTSTIRTWLNETFRKIKRFAMWFWEKFFANGRWILSLSCAVMVAYIASAIGLMFLPPPTVETSKVLFKGANTRPIVGRWTDTSENHQAQVSSLIRRNLTRCSTKYGSFSAIRSGQYIYTVKHALRRVLSDNVPFELSFQPTMVCKDMWTVNIMPSQVAAMDNTDFAVIYSPRLPAARNVDSWFLTQEDLMSMHDCDVTMAYFDQSGLPIVHTKTPKVLEPSMEISTKDGHEDLYHQMVCMDSPSVPGSSGCPVMTSHKQEGARTIFGIQSVNKHPWSYAQAVTQELIAKGKELIDYTRQPIEEEGPLICDETELPRMESFVTEHLDVAGSVPRSHRAGAYGETKFVKTCFDGILETDHVPAILSAKHPRVGRDEHPLAHSINKFGRDIMKELPEKHLQKAIKDISQYVKYQIGQPQLRLMEFSEIVLGHDHPGSGPMNLKTSPGLPYVLHKRQQKGKRDWFDVNEDGILEEVSESLLDDFRDTEQHLRRGFIPSNSMYEFAKDELRPYAKAYGNPIKTRSISVLNMVHMMLFRKYHLDLTAHMHQAANGDFQSCVGINPEGPEWTRMFQNLTAMGRNNCFDLDVGNWDGHFTPQLFFAVVAIVNRLYGDDENSEEATVRYAIAHNALFGYDQIDDMVFKKLRGMPSGFGGTAIYNTLAHMIVYYVFWLMLCERSGRQVYANWNAYISHVCVRFYGDDVVCSVHESVIEWFSPSAVAALYSDHGWPTTSAAKKSGMGVGSIFEVQFLKRKFSVDPELGEVAVHGDIDESVINNLLIWMRRTSRTVTKQQLLENVHNAMQFAFAKGERYYNRLYECVNDVLTSNGCSAYYIDYECMRECMLTERFGVRSAFVPV